MSECLIVFCICRRILENNRIEMLAHKIRLYFEIKQTERVIVSTVILYIPTRNSGKESKIEREREKKSSNEEALVGFVCFFNLFCVVVFFPVEFVLMLIFGAGFGG